MCLSCFMTRRVSEIRVLAHLEGLVILLIYANMLACGCVPALHVIVVFPCSPAVRANVEPRADAFPPQTVPVSWNTA